MAGSGTAFHLAYLEAQAAQPNEPIFPLLRCCPGGGAPKPPGLHERVKRELGGVGILSGWGLTEAPVLTMGTPRGSRREAVRYRRKAATRGSDPRDWSRWPCGFLSVSLESFESGPLSRCSGMSIERSTQRRFDEDGYVRTGDIGTVDSDGFVRITGRLKDVVIRNGENVATAEVEDLLRGHPEVVDVAVLGLPDQRTGERVCAVVELHPGTQALTVELVGAYLQEKGLRRIAWPEQVEVVCIAPTKRGRKGRQSSSSDRLDGERGAMRLKWLSPRPLPSAIQGSGDPTRRSCALILGAIVPRRNALQDQRDAQIQAFAKSAIDRRLPPSAAERRQPSQP